MTVRVELWASLAERAGRRRIRIEMGERGDVRGLLAAVVRAEPSLEGAIERAAVARNGRVISRDAPLRGGDEVALLPPVSGG